MPSLSLIPNPIPEKYKKYFSTHYFKKLENSLFNIHMLLSFFMSLFILYDIKQQADEGNGHYHPSETMMNINMTLWKCLSLPLSAMIVFSRFNEASQNERIPVVDGDLAKLMFAIIALDKGALIKSIRNMSQDAFDEILGNRITAAMTGYRDLRVTFSKLFKMLKAETGNRIVARRIPAQNIEPQQIFLYRLQADVARTLRLEQTALKLLHDRTPVDFGNLARVLTTKMNKK